MRQHTTRSINTRGNPQADVGSDTYAVSCGRFSPFHRGHEAVVRRMLDIYGEKRSCLVIGSSNAPLSERDYFTADERRSFILKIFPHIPTVFAPDYESDDQWLRELDAGIVKLGINPERARYFAGSIEDVPFFFRADREVVIVDRYDGTTPVISGTEVRKALMRGAPIDGLVNPIIEPHIRALFRTRDLP